MEWDSRRWTSRDLHRKEHGGLLKREKNLQFFSLFNNPSGCNVQKRPSLFLRTETSIVKKRGFVGGSIPRRQRFLFNGEHGCRRPRLPAHRCTLKGPLHSSGICYSKGHAVQILSLFLTTILVWCHDPPVQWCFGAMLFQSAFYESMRCYGSAIGMMSGCCMSETTFRAGRF